MAEILDIPESKMEIVAGETGRDKLISILDLDADTAQKRIIAHLA